MKATLLLAAIALSFSLSAQYTLNVTINGENQKRGTEKYEKFVVEERFDIPREDLLFGNVHAYIEENFFPAIADSVSNAAWSYHPISSEYEVVPLARLCDNGMSTPWNHHFFVQPFEYTPKVIERFNHEYSSGAPYTPKNLMSYSDMLRVKSNKSALLSTVIGITGGLSGALIMGQSAALGGVILGAAAIPAVYLGIRGLVLGIQASQASLVGTFAEDFPDDFKFSLDNAAPDEEVLVTHR